MERPAISQDIGLAVDAHGLVHLRLLNSQGGKLAILVMAPEQARKVAATLNRVADKAAQVAATPMTEVH